MAVASDFRQITDALNRRALQFCMQFLPNGKRKGKYWCASDILDSNKGGDSFVVNINDSDAENCGLWFENGDPADGGRKCGSIVNIIMAQRQMTYPQAVKFARDWLGISSPSDYRYKVSETAKSDKDVRKIAVKHLYPLSEDSEVFRYLTEKRGLTPEILRKYRVQQCNWWFGGFGKEVPAIAFPVWSCKGDKAQVLNVKYIAVERNAKGNKECSQDPNGTCHLWGWQAIDDDASELVICEGEIDAMSVAMCGYNAVSVPQGAHADSADGKVNAANQWIDNDWERLSCFERIKICMDNDEVGKSAAQTLYRRLGAHRCELVEIPAPAKDPNDLLLDNPDYIKNAVDCSRAIDPIQLKRPSDYKQKLWDRLDGKQVYIGRKMPWNLGDHFRIRNGELTVVSGYSGHGKTEWLNDLLLNLCVDGGERACIASLEVPIDKTLYSLWCQTAGCKDDFTVEGYLIVGLRQNAFDFLEQYFMFYDCVGVARIDDVIEVFSYAARRYGVRLFCLDSVMCLDIAEDDLDSVKKVMQKLAKFVIEFDCHLFVVAHAKKPNDKRREDKNPPTKYDVSGSKSITDLAHNVVIVWRNISKTERMERARMVGDNWKDIQAEPDATFFVGKQRNGTGELAYKQVWFDVRSKQFRDQYSKPIRHFVDGSPVMGDLEI